MSVEMEKVVEEVRTGTSLRRIYFTVKDTPASWQPAVFLGRVGDADEVSLNGVKIGGEGRIGERFVTAAKAERMYRIPQNLLRLNEKNLLEIKALKLYPKGGSVDYSVTVGDYRDLLVRKMALQYAAMRVEFILFAFMFIWIEFCVLLYIKGMFSKEYMSFGVVMLLYSAAYYLNSLTFYETGLKTFFIQKLIISFYAALPAAMLCFFICAFHEKPKTALRFNMAFSLLLSAAALFVRGQEAGTIFIYLWFFSAASSGLTALILAIKSYRKKRFEAGAVLAGIVWICVSGGYCLISIVTGLLPQINLCSHYPPDFILLFWIITIQYGLTSRYVRIKRSMHILSERLITTCEDERKRLAFDLHDGMGQNLAAVKFNLQRVNKDIKHKLIDSVIEEVSGSIKDLRDIAADLMPVSLQAMGLKKTIEAYAGKFSEKTGIKVSVSSDDLPRLPEKIELNVFRIFQEVVSNAIKHSRASSIKIYLRHNSPHILLEVSDDGCGFDYQKAHAKSSGMGLLIIMERIRLMRGTLTVTSIKDKGTTIRVEVPVK